MTGSRPESPHLEIPSHYHFLSQSLTLSPGHPSARKVSATQQVRARKQGREGVSSTKPGSHFSHGGETAKPNSTSDQSQSRTARSPSAHCCSATLAAHCLLLTGSCLRPDYWAPCRPAPYPPPPLASQARANPHPQAKNMPRPDSPSVGHLP